MATSTIVLHSLSVSVRFQTEERRRDALFSYKHRSSFENMAERFFGKIMSDVLDASEKLSNRLEEGLTALFTGELPKIPQDVVPTPPETPPIDSESFEDELGTLENDVGGGSPLEGIARSVLGDILDSQVRDVPLYQCTVHAFDQNPPSRSLYRRLLKVHPQTAMEHFHAFRHAVTWTEPFVLGLLAFHVAMFAFCLFASQRGRSLAPRLCVMVIIAVLVKSAEFLNQLGAEHWRSFATQNYFDRRGIFVSVMLCGPLLLYSFIMLAFFLREAAHLLVQVKTAEIKRKRLKKEDPKATKRRDKSDKKD